MWIQRLFRQARFPVSRIMIETLSYAAWSAEPFWRKKKFAGVENVIVFNLLLWNSDVK